MKFGKLFAILLCIAVTIASDPAHARRGGGGRSGAHHGSHHRHHSHGSVAFAGAAFLPAWYYGYSPVYAETPAQVQYIERAPEQGPHEEDAWLYCAVAGAYFPSVVECPGGWQRVPGKPPG